MKNVSKFLFVVAFSVGTLMALLNFTTAKSTATNVDGVIRTDVSVSVADPEPPPGEVVEQFRDGCTGDVVIKVPYTGPDGPSLDDDDIVLARTQAMCRLVEGSPPTHEGVCQHNPNQSSPWTDTIQYHRIKNGVGRFRWFCRTQAERSRCASGTTRARFRLKPNGKLETQCLK